MELNADFSYFLFSLILGLDKALLDLIYLKYCCKNNFPECTFTTRAMKFSMRMML